MNYLLQENFRDSLEGTIRSFAYFQPIENYSEWRLLYFIAFILLVGFFVLNMFVGVVVENFHRCREEQEKEERVRRAAKRAKQMEKKRRSKLCVLLSVGSATFYSGSHLTPVPKAVQHSTDLLALSQQLHHGTATVLTDSI
jgi:hypothetical protein